MATSALAISMNNNLGEILMEVLLCLLFLLQFTYAYVIIRKKLFGGSVIKERDFCFYAAFIMLFLTFAVSEIFIICRD